MHDDVDSLTAVCHETGGACSSDAPVDVQDLKEVSCSRSRGDTDLKELYLNPEKWQL